MLLAHEKASELCYCVRVRLELAKANYGPVLIARYPKARWIEAQRVHSAPRTRASAQDLLSSVLELRRCASCAIAAMWSRFRAIRFGQTGGSPLEADSWREESTPRRNDKLADSGAIGRLSCAVGVRCAPGRSRRSDFLASCAARAPQRRMRR